MFRSTAGQASSGTRHFEALIVRQSLKTLVLTALIPQKVRRQVSALCDTIGNLIRLIADVILLS